MRTTHASDQAFEEWVDGADQLRTHSVQAAFRQGWNKGEEHAAINCPHADKVDIYRRWAQKLLDVSEYVGTDREDASRWQCAFGCSGYSYESTEGVTTPDGAYKRTPPASHDWHAETCLARKLAADLAA